MNTNKQVNHSISYSIFIGLAVTATLLISGCSTLGMDRSEKARTTMSEVEKNINELVSQVSKTDASLESLIKPEQEDTKKAFKVYSKNVNKMEKQGKHLVEQAEIMNAQGNDYFDEWRTSGNTYKNPQIQELSEQRRADLSADFVKVSESSIGVRGSIRSYLSNHKEIQAYLSNDLTSQGIESITPIAEKAVADGEDVKQSVKPILAAIRNINEKMRTGSKQK